jgi:hypothetical protein
MLIHGKHSINISFEHWYIITVISHHPQSLTLLGSRLQIGLKQKEKCQANFQHF